MGQARRLRVVLYHRVSTRDQHPELAERELRDAAALRGFEVAAYLSETGSGARNNRPVHLQVMEMARRREIDALLVWKLDRFGRSSLDVLTQIEELRRLGVRFISTTQGIDVKPDSDPTVKLTLTVLAACAEFEREMAIERTTMAIDEIQRTIGEKGYAVTRRGPNRGRVFQKLGRPTTLEGKALERAIELRAEGAELQRSWGEVALALSAEGWGKFKRTQVAMAVRRAAARAATLSQKQGAAVTVSQKGTADEGDKGRGNGGSDPSGGAP